MLARIDKIIAKILYGLVRGYQLVLSPYWGAHCRFTPTCSAYAIEALERFGAIRGSMLTVKRLLKCHPWHCGGYDPIPPEPLKPNSK